MDKDEVFIDPELSELFEILSWRRAADSEGELQLIQKYIIPTGANRDNFGNWYLRIGEAPVLWSSHTDTVHRDTEKGINQKLAIDASGILGTSDGSCLGADNGVGVWIMLKMIEAGQEGLYVFHRQEETGGKGSQYFAANHRDLLNDIKFAIAFDRRRTTSVITHQGYRTCSDEFAESLIEELGMGHEKDDGGTFTDTKMYARLIPECTNISAGFQSEHSKMEVLDTHYAKSLMQTMCKIDVSNLVAQRDPKGKDEWPTGYGWMGGYYNRNYYDSYASMYEDDLIQKSDTDTYMYDMITGNPHQVYRVLKAWGMASDMVMDLEKLDLVH